MKGEKSKLNTERHQPDSNQEPSCLRNIATAAPCSPSSKLLCCKFNIACSDVIRRYASFFTYMSDDDMMKKVEHCISDTKLSEIQKQNFQA